MCEHPSVPQFFWNSRSRFGDTVKQPCIWPVNHSSHTAAPGCSRGDCGLPEEGSVIGCPRRGWTLHGRSHNLGVCRVTWRLVGTWSQSLACGRSASVNAGWEKPHFENLWSKALIQSNEMLKKLINRNRSIFSEGHHMMYSLERPLWQWAFKNC